MSTLDYLSVPHAATRLHNQSQSSNNSQSNSIRSAPKIRTSLPRPPSESTSEGPTSPLKSFSSSSAFNLLPQILLSSSVPSVSSSSSDPVSSNDSKSNAARKRLKNHLHQPVVLLSNRDPLSIQITTVNFKRFIERVGPVFWLQDRIEEIVFWKRGPKLTVAWLAAYGLLCYFPRLVFVLPQCILIAIILASVHYPIHKPIPSPLTFSEPASAKEPLSAAESPLPASVAEESVDWQANIQAIQNLMGFYADLHTALVPYLAHLSLSPNNPQLFKPKSPYTLPLLTILTLTLPLSILLVTSTFFPTRLVCFLCGAGPVFSLNPEVRRWLSEILTLFTYLRPDVLYPSIQLPIPPIIRKVSSRLFHISLSLQIVIDAYSIALLRKRFKMWLQRSIDDNNLSDEVWNSEMREVELWENERLNPGVNPTPPSTGITTSPTAARIALPALTDSKEERKMNQTPARPPLPQQHQRSRSSFFGSSSTSGWSKSHLKSNERVAWTRGRDGWSGVVGLGNDGDGTVSNLTFSLAPNWEFVPTEGWRADLVGFWVKEKGDDDDEGMVRSVLGADENGWVYTNDVWLVPADHAYSGAVTRRRRWVRRIWYNSRASEL
ncbi:hypothetical protein GYMLUDRAFT_34116 [Collybiopsis luxurians FD-317 M1]|nr:hypothetical protein GYMLUDRAFT_34116 [Collybiopsis luxurians FD-317 M1]